MAQLGPVVISERFTKMAIRGVRVTITLTPEATEMLAEIRGEASQEAACSALINGMLERLAAAQRTAGQRGSEDSEYFGPGD